MGREFPGFVDTEPHAEEDFTMLAKPDDSLYNAAVGGDQLISTRPQPSINCWANRSNSSRVIS